MSNAFHAVVEFAESMLKEAMWLWDKSVPSMDEYMTNGYLSFAFGPIVLPTLYCVGPKLSEEIVRTPELHHLYEVKYWQPKHTLYFKAKLVNNKVMPRCLWQDDTEYGYIHFTWNCNLWIHQFY